MAQEIERKYLVKGSYKEYAHHTYSVRQGYLATDTGRTVRIRIRDGQAFITIKGPTEGIRRFEWEKEIPVSEAEELLKLCIPFIIHKKRHLVHFNNYLIEVDEFMGMNRGLVLAEIELHNENEQPDLPDWIGNEVSDDFRYHNSYLSAHPFSNWTENKTNEA